MRQEVPGEAAPQQEPEETAPQESPPNNECDSATEDPDAPPAKPVYDGKFDMKLDLRARSIIGQFAARIRDDDPEYLATTAKHFSAPRHSSYGAGRQERRRGAKARVRAL